MTGESDRERVDRRETLAYEAGQLKAVVDSHEKRLNRLNGSLDRVADRLETLSQQQVTEAAVKAALKDALKSATSDHISKRMYLISVAAVIATILAAFVASGRIG